MYRTDNKDIWRVFREHHYLSAEINKACVCYTVYWDNVLVGFASYLYLVSGTIKHAWRGHRWVVLPDYQNLGITTATTEFLGEYYLSQGQKYYFRSTHLRLGAHCTNSPLWVPSASNGKKANKPGNSNRVNYGADNNLDWDRIAYSFEYMGKDYATKEHIYIHVDDSPNIDYNIMREDLKALKEKYWLCVVTGEIKTPSRIEDICLELGIRTQLLYHTKKGVAEINSKYKKEKIITKWDKAFSERVRRWYNV